MPAQNQFLEIVSWFQKQCKGETATLAPQANPAALKTLETAIGTPFPEALHTLYQLFDGETGDGYGTFLGHSLVSIQEMNNNLEFCKSLIKPPNPAIPNPEKASELTESIINICKQAIPAEYQANWHKLFVESGPGSIGGPYFYPKQETTEKERLILRFEFSEKRKIIDLATELHEIEKETFNWDELEITAYGNGTCEVKRTNYDFDEELPLSSFPVGAIRKKYFHYKWLPIIKDHGGNYIGIDLDPDSKGTVGQVIVFGRDEEAMFVIANSWETFLELTLKLIQSKPEVLLEDVYLHNVYRSEIIQ